MGKAQVAEAGFEMNERVKRVEAALEDVAFSAAKLTAAGAAQVLGSPADRVVVDPEPAQCMNHRRSA